MTIHLTMHGVLETAGTLALGAILYHVVTALAYVTRTRWHGRKRR